jgi:hypothetical protein
MLELPPRGRDPATRLKEGTAHRARSPAPSPVRLGGPPRSRSRALAGGSTHLTRSLAPIPARMGLPPWGPRSRSPVLGGHSPSCLEPPRSLAPSPDSDVNPGPVGADPARPGPGPKSHPVGEEYLEDGSGARARDTRVALVLRCGYCVPQCMKVPGELAKVGGWHAPSGQRPPPRLPTVTLQPLHSSLVASVSGGRPPVCSGEAPRYPWSACASHSPCCGRVPVSVRHSNLQKLFSGMATSPDTVSRHKLNHCAGQRRLPSSRVCSRLSQNHYVALPPLPRPRPAEVETGAVGNSTPL